MLYEDVQISQSTDDAYCEKEKASVINEALLELPQRQRHAVQLVYFSECTNREAAEAMKVSVRALESLLSRGRAQLKDRLSDLCSPLVPGTDKKREKDAKDKRRPVRLTVEGQAQSQAEYGLKRESLYGIRYWHYIQLLLIPVSDAGQSAKQQSGAGAGQPAEQRGRQPVRSKRADTTDQHNAVD
jgi:predicted DNA-binding protein (UPF0251 family)